MPSREPAGLPYCCPPFLLCLPALALTACGGGGGFELPATTGTLEVTTVTTGDEMDPNGYTVQVDGEGPQAIDIAGRIQRTLVEPGNHTLRLDGLASNCSVGGDNPRTVAIKAGETLTSTFEVTCTATTGGILVTTVTGGASLDPDGYAVVLDGVEQGAIAASGQVTLTGLGLGSHVVGLSGLAGNCQLQGENLRAVTVTPAGSAPVDYAITCAAPPSNAGTLRIVTSTTGNAPPPAGYGFAVDGGPTQPIAASGSISIINLAPGSHRVQLSGLPDNCRVQGDNPRTVNVTAGGSTDASFAVVCTRPEGSIRVSVSTSGNPSDPNGYLAQLDNAAPGVHVNADGSVRFSNVPVGSHTITLTDVASACTVNGGPSQSAAVTTGGTAEVRFSVSCSPAGPSSGSIVVHTQTSGPSPDDGYTVVVDGNERGSILANGEQTVTVSAGGHEVELTDIAGNCQVQGENRRTITVTAGASTPVQYSIACVTPPAETGSLRITTTTTGPNPDDNGYGVAVDDASSQHIGTNDAITLSNQTTGVHTVQLSGVESNCTVEGTNPRSVSVAANGTAQVSFTVTCASTAGNIHVTTSTSGDDPDTDGYEVSVDGGAGRAIDSDGGSITFEGLESGEHVVRISGVASNCSVGGGDEHHVTVPAGGTAEEGFTITCTAKTGSIHVTTSTTGDNPDTDGYEVAVDGGTGHPVDSDGGSATFDGLTPGEHTVRISGVAPNCSVAGGEEHLVNVAADAIIEEGFTITCSAPVGSIDVNVSTSGEEPDDQYTVTLDDTAPGLGIGGTGSTRFTDVPAGPHKVDLSDIATNCTVGGDGPSRSFSLGGGEARQLAFEVACVPTDTGGDPPVTE